MATSKELERQILDLPPADRERLARMAWDSLSDDPAAMADSALDAQGLNLARARDEAITRGRTIPIAADGFRRRTGGGVMRVAFKPDSQLNLRSSRGAH